MSEDFERDREPLDLDEVTEDLEGGLKELIEAQEEYLRAYKYFEGTSQEKFITRDLQRMLSGSENDFQVNLLNRVVLAVSDRLEISAVTAKDKKDRTDPDDLLLDDSLVNNTMGTSGASGEMTVEPGPYKIDPNRMFHPGSPVDLSVLANRELMLDRDSQFDAESTAALNRDVWHANELDIEAPEIHEKACMLGDAYLFVWGSDEDEEADPEQPVTVFYNSPLTTRLFYDRENPRKKKFAIKRWEVGSKDNKRVRMDVYYPHFIIKMISKQDSRGERPQDFLPYVSDGTTDENGMVENPYGEIPIFHFRTGRPYGRPEHLQGYGPQDALTKLISGQMTATDFAAFPQRWALSRTNANTDGDIDWGDDDTQSPEELQSNLISGAGRVWLLDNVDKVGQFPAADADQFLKPMDKFIELMAASTGTPLSYLHKVRGTSSTPLSGASQRQTEVILMKKIEARQRSYASTWRDALGFAMRILGYDVTVNVKWGSSQADNDKDTWEGAIAQQKAGVPIRQTLLEQGYTEAEVTSWGYTEMDPNGSNFVSIKNPHNPFHNQQVSQSSINMPTYEDRRKQEEGTIRAQEAPEEEQ